MWQVAVEGLKEKTVVALQEGTPFIPEEVMIAYRSQHWPGMPVGEYWVVFDPKQQEGLYKNIFIKEVRATDLWRPLPLPEGKGRNELGKLLEALRAEIR